MQYFDTEKLKGLIKDFYTITQMRITVFDADFNELIAYPEERAAICRYVRGNSPRADATCKECDKQACLAAARSLSPYIYKCHLGLTEIISPILFDGTVIGYLFFAHIFAFDSREKGVAALTAACLRFSNINAKDVEKLTAEMPIFDKNYTLAASRLLSTVASYLYFERASYIKSEDVTLKIDEYISDNLTDNLTVKALSKLFGIGKTRLYLLTRELYREGLAKHVKNLRLEKAKKLLLENSDLSLSDVAERSGLGDYNYFIAQFKARYGVTPKRYAKSAKK